MAVALTIHADSRAEAVAWLDNLRQQLGLTATLTPVSLPGTDKWLARLAQTAEPEPGQH